MIPITIKETNGRIKLSWQQLVWGISLLSVILLTYADLKNKVSILSDQVGQIYTKAEEDKFIFGLQQENKLLHSDLDQQNKLLQTSIRVINKKLGIETGELK